MEDHLITLEELQATVTKINKKIILVNSSKYEEPAFEYLLDIIDESEAIAFIINERKIYTHGEYFGGDLWEDTLNYFNKYTVLNDEDEIVSQIVAQSSKDIIQFKGEGGISLYTDYDIRRDASTMHIKYDLEAAVDQSSIIQVSNDRAIMLDVKDNKLSLAEYVPLTVTFRSTPMLEYDSGTQTLSIPITINDPSRVKSLSFSASAGVVPMYDINNKVVNVSIPNNTKVTIYADFSDGKVKSTSSTTIDWGYCYAYGTDIIGETNIQNHIKGIANRFSEISFNLDIPESKYGWFAYPANASFEFLDVTNGLRGGWTKHSQFRRYDSGILYQVWCTEQSGLGSTSWKIVKKQ